MKNGGKLELEIKLTYLQMRRGMAVLAYTFPFVLLLGGFLLEQESTQRSISAYYHTCMRNWFVGVLCAIGSFLILYKGKKWENFALNIAGFSALAIAFFPADNLELCEYRSKSSLQAIIHGIASVTFFFSISFVCIFDYIGKLIEKLIRTWNSVIFLTFGLLNLKKNISNEWIYSRCSVVMLLSIITGIFYYFLSDNSKEYLCLFRPTFLIETIAIITFSIFWTQKSNEIDESISWIPTWLANRLNDKASVID